MAQRPSGRPKATHPRDVRVTIRLTEREVDQLYRSMSGQGQSLAGLIRHCIERQLQAYSVFGVGRAGLNDSDEARLQRARRAARRANASPQPNLESRVGQALQDTGEALVSD